MSSRMLKKLQHGNAASFLIQADDGKQLSDNEDDDQQEEVLEEGLRISPSKCTHLNPYDLLNQQSFSESEVKEDDNETEHASAATKLPTGAAALKKKKKKRKRKKCSDHTTGNHISSEDNNELTDKQIPSDGDAVIKVCDAHTQTCRYAQRPRPDKSLLKVEARNLNPQNEMRRTFGKRVVKTENKRGRQKHTLKTTYMVTAKESWPPITKNIITMKPCPPPDLSVTARYSDPDETTHWFMFEHSQYYQGIQNLFLPAMERTDSDFLISLIKRCPYHVDSLIQLSEFCKLTEDYALAAELIERAVLILESSLHPSFSLSSGMSRLDYRRQENRAFFIVLFKHAQYLEARACSRTAFEISKLILSMDPELDPLAIILIIDYYALRSKQYAWFVKFYEDYNAARNVSQLPNMAYSYALALYLLNGECEKADQALQYALLMFPGVLRPLLDEMSVQTDKRVLACQYFQSEVNASQSPSLHQLVCLYVCRAKIIWRQNNLLQWLEQNVNFALDRIAVDDECIAEYAQKRAARYATPPRPILRHVFLSDFKEKVPLAPFVVKEKDPIVMYDPLPPFDSINCYERKSSSSSPTTGTNRSVSMFFQSMLPSFNINNVGGPQNAGNDEAGEQNELNDEVAQVDRQLQALNVNLENAAAEGNAAGNEAGTSYRELTQSLTTIVDAMRDFLQNFRITEHFPAGEGENNGSSEEDTSDYYD